ncbi:MAG TPA: tryptophan 7-halogenase, partial [Sphingorhabdus sp.]|nr:tryptophan 7-halogenase [Sphingorhabdus sp.]
RYCAAMDIPDSLKFKIDHFRRYGRHIPRDMDLFGPPSWLAVQIGQGNFPDATDPIGSYRDEQKGREWLGKLRSAMATAAGAQPTHQQFIDQHCRAD